MILSVYKSGFNFANVARRESGRNFLDPRTADAAYMNTWDSNLRREQAERETAILLRIVHQLKSITTMYRAMHVLEEALRHGDDLMNIKRSFQSFI